LWQLIASSGKGSKRENIKDQNIKLLINIFVVQPSTKEENELTK